MMKRKGKPDGRRVARVLRKIHDRIISLTNEERGALRVAISLLDARTEDDE